MRKYFYLFLLILISFSFLFPCEVSAAKKKKKNVVTLPAIDVVSIDGEKTIFGSVLDPNVNQVLFLLPKPLLNVIRKLGLNKVSVKVTSALDSTKAFLVPPDGVSIQLKRLNGMAARYLVTNISSLTTPSGITISPSALPKDDYKLKVTGELLDVTTKKFSYQTPILIVGTVKSKGSGFVTVEDLTGNEISDKTVAISENGTFITEVRADKLISNQGGRKYLSKTQIGEDLDDEENEDTPSDTEVEINGEIEAGVVHAVTNKDLFAVVPLNHSVEINAAIANKPIEINDSTTLAANLGKEYDVIAKEVAKEELEELESGEEEDEIFEDFDCDIYQFSDRCDIDDDEEFGLIGADFRDFTQATDCSSPEYDLIKDLIAASPEETNVFIGKGYCEFATKTTELDEGRPCKAYSDILLDFKEGILSELPCPPENCKQFRNIKPPRCVEPVDFCKEEDLVNKSASRTSCHGASCKSLYKRSIVPACVRKPVRDLYCARIGIDVTEEECLGITEEAGGVLVSWKIETSSHGNEFCVPDEVQATNFTPGFTDVFSEDTKQRAEECETVTCHRLCEEGILKELPPELIPISSSSNCEVCDCHLACDADAGRIIDCGDPKSRFFAASCCNQSIVSASSFSKSDLRDQFFGGGGFGFGPTSPRNPGFPPPIRECLCQSVNNFDNKGFVTEGAINRCKDKCPRGFEIDENNELCLPICPGGLVRGPNGNCRKECPKELIEDDFGNCKCPEGTVFGRSGKCEEVSCPDHCKDIPLVRKLMENHISTGPGFTPASSGPGFTSPSVGSGFTPTGGTQPGGGFSPYSNIPSECKGCFDFGNLGVCPPGQKKDPAGGKCVPDYNCGPDQYLDRIGTCRCNSDGSTPGPEGCKTQTVCSSNMLPNPKANEPNQATCICPTGLPYWDGNKCVSQCVGGNPTPSSIIGLSLNSPIPCDSGRTSKCPPEKPYLHLGGCVSTCPPPLIPGTPPITYATKVATLKENHDFGYQLECLCLGNVRPNASGECPSTLRYCGLSEIPNTSKCTCARGGSSPTGTTACVCTAPGQTYTEAGCYSSLNYCPPAISTATGCICAPGATPSAPNSTCQCTTPTQTYTATGCGGTSTRPCTAGEGPSNGCYCFGSGFTGADGKCQCSGGIQYTGGGCGPTTNYCAPAISTTTGCTCAPGATPSGPNSTCQCPNNNPAYAQAGCGTTFNYCSLGIIVGTSGCTCNPSGGGYNSIGYCTCPSGSIYPYTKETGCTSSTSRPCTAGEGPSNGCYCFGSGFTGANGKCQCSSGVIYTGGGCGTATNYCAPAISTTAGCTCAPGATPSGVNSTCQCTTAGQTYTATGCGTTTTNHCSPGILAASANCTCNPSGGSYISNGYCACPTNSGPYTKEYGCASTTNYCAPAISTTTGCTCAPGATPSGVNSTCQCTTAGQTYTATGCGTTTTNHCSPGILVASANCTCNPSGGSYIVNGYCACPTNSSPYTKEYGCTSTTNYCAPAISTTTGCTCAPGATATGINGSCQCTTAGQTYTASGCGTTTSYCGVGIAPSTGNCTCAPGATSPTGITACTCTIAGQTYTPSGCNRVCAVGEVYNASNPCTCAGSGYIYQGVCTCATGQTYTSTDGCAQVILNSVSISGTNVNVNYSKNFTTCVHLLNATTNTILHIQNHFCASTGPITVPTTSFNPALTTGQQVKLCHGNNYSICSPLTTITTGSTTTPIAPTGLTLTQSVASVGTVNLSWVDNSTDETYFSISRRLFGAVAWTIVTSALGPNITTYTDSGLTAGTYEYHINACNAYGCSVDSTIAAFTVPAPSSTITLTSVSISGSNVTISYNVNSYACLLVKDINNTTIQPGNLCGSGSFNSVLSTASFTPTLVSGTQVKLCNQDNLNNCSSLVTVTSSVTCTLPKVLDSATNTCVCPQGRSPDSVVGCTCPSGQVDDGTTCVPGQFTLTSAVKSGTSVTFTFSKNFSQICYSLKGPAGNQPSSFCQVSGAPISATVLGQETSVQLCSTNWSNVCTNFVTVTGN